MIELSPSEWGYFYLAAEHFETASFSNAELRRLTGESRSTVYRRVKKLVSVGLFKESETGKYQLTDLATLRLMRFTHETPTVTPRFISETSGVNPKSDTFLKEYNKTYIHCCCNSTNLHARDKLQEIESSSSESRTGQNFISWLREQLELYDLQTTPKTHKQVFNQLHNSELPVDDYQDYILERLPRISAKVQSGQWEANFAVATIASKKSIHWFREDLPNDNNEQSDPSNVIDWSEIEDRYGS